MADRTTDEFGSDVDDMLSDDVESGEAAGTEEESGAADGTEGTESDASSEAALRKMQSERDKETARANKAAKELAALKGDTAPASSGEQAPAPSSGGADPWVQASKGNYRDQLYDSDPSLKELGLSSDLIAGSTPAEMRKSFEALQTTARGVVSAARNKVLVEHGLQPEPEGGVRTTPVNYTTMSSEEFEKVVANVLAEQ